jgi:hypothetical protein
MCNKLMKYVSIVLVLGICGSAMAAVDWLGGAGNYNDSTKWSSGVVPTKGDGQLTWVTPSDSDVLINTAGMSAFEFFANGGSVTVGGGSFETQWKIIATANGAQFNVNDGTVTVGQNLYVGDWGQATVNLSGGTMNVSDTLVAGAGGAADGTLNITGGIMTTKWNWYLGDTGKATVNVSNGTVSVGDHIIVGQWGTATGYLNISGGSVTTGGITLSGIAGTGHVDLTGGLLQANTLAINNIGVSTFDIAGGTLNLKGNITSLPGVTGYGIPGNLQFAYDAGTDFTSITGIPEPITLLLLGAGGFIAFARRPRS